MKTSLLLFALTLSTCVFSQIGIGTMTPTATLDIDGDVRIRNVPVETIMDVAQDSLLVISRDGRIKTISATEITDRALPSIIKGNFNGSGLVNLSLATGTQDIPFDQEDFDMNDEYDTSTNTFTAKQDGIYSVSVQIEADGTLGVATNFGVLILKNGVVEVRNSYANTGVAGSNVTPPVRNTQTIVQLITGDTIRFQIEGDVSLGSVDLIADNRDSFFTINQVR